MSPLPVQLVATDLDGTLLSPDRVLSPRTAATLEAVTTTGVPVVVITGRSHRSAVPILCSHRWLRWIVCSNGASLYDQEAAALVEHRPLPLDPLAELMETLAGKFPGAGLAWETPSGLFHSPLWAEVVAASGHRFAPARSLPVALPRPELTPGPGNEVFKLLIVHDALAGYEWFEALAPHVPFGLHVSTSGAIFVEVTESGANKGAALERMCQRLGVDRAATVAFGDHANDVEMLRSAGRGYAMANGHPRAKEVAGGVAPDHRDDGVARVLEELLGLDRIPMGRLQSAPDDAPR